MPRTLARLAARSSAREPLVSLSFFSVILPSTSGAKGSREEAAHARACGLLETARRMRISMPGLNARSRAVASAPRNVLPHPGSPRRGIAWLVVLKL